MSDQDALEPKPEEKRPDTALIDLPTFGLRVMQLRLRRGWRTATPLIDAIAEYVRDHELARGIGKDTMYRLERGVQQPDLDQVMLLDAVLEPEEGVEFLMPRKLSAPARTSQE